ncbi:hypothetical protein [Actinocorallia sp. B10E7]|uniref:hypothetical protein n=1 Tax=Actinocorallia sp. B10E7 TaxID=3153558 RepID=UPI00325FDC75
MGERHRAMVDVGVGCGLRQGELFGLAVDDVEWASARRAAVDAFFAGRLDADDDAKALEMTSILKEAAEKGASEG